MGGSSMHLVLGCPWIRAISQAPERGLAVHSTPRQQSVLELEGCATRR